MYAQLALLKLLLVALRSIEKYGILHESITKAVVIVVIATMNMEAGIATAATTMMDRRKILRE